MAKGLRVLLTLTAAVTLLLLLWSTSYAQGAASQSASAPTTPTAAPTPAASPTSVSTGTSTPGASHAAESEPAISGSRAATGNSDEELRKRVAQLEAEMEMMRAEINRLKQPASTPSTAAVVTPPAAPVAKDASTVQPPPAKPAPDEHKPGIEVGPVRIIPYGNIYLNLFGNTSGTNNTDVPLFATTTVPGNVSVTARQTRLGLRLEGPDMGGAKTSGVLEADFAGGFPSIGIGEDFGVVRLRLAYFKLDWKNTTFEAGQDWTIFSPANPVSIASVATPEFAAAGNLFARIPQIRVEQRFMDGGISWAGAVLASTTGDYPATGTTPAVLQPGSGALSLRPAFESRLALNGKNWLGSKKTATVGLSAHYGWARVATTPRNIDLDVMGVAGDWFIPFGSRVSLAGEAFFGRNLAAFQGDVFQTFVPDFAYRVGTALVPGGPRAPGTRGGWAQLCVTPPGLNDKLSFYGSFGMDDPRDRDFVTLATHDSRLRNLAVAVSGIYKLTQQISWGFEYRRLDTLYLVSGRLNDNHLNLAASYSF
ncbi:MAG: type IV pilus assembly protein FimV [Blastocatellia bacterium]